MKYILQKDLPDSKAGDIYVETSPGVYNKNGDPKESYWLAHCVENSPEWFLPESENDKIYFGTDLSLKKFCVEIMKDKLMTADAMIEESKKLFNWLKSGN